MRYSQDRVRKGGRVKDQLSAEVDVDSEGRSVNEESEITGFM